MTGFYGNGSMGSSGLPVTFPCRSRLSRRPRRPPAPAATPVARYRRRARPTSETGGAPIRKPPLTEATSSAAPTSVVGTYHTACMTIANASPASFAIPKMLGVLSAGAWLSWALAAILAAKAVGVELSLVEALFVTAALNLGVAIPSSPGFVGTYQWLGVSALGEPRLRAGRASRPGACARRHPGRLPESRAPGTPPTPGCRSGRRPQESGSVGYPARRRATAAKTSLTWASRERRSRSKDCLNRVSRPATRVGGDPSPSSRPHLPASRGRPCCDHSRHGHHAAR